MNEKKPSVKGKVEAILFSVGHKISLDEISKLSRSKKDEVLVALRELQKEYDEKQSSMILVEENDSWNLTVRDHLISVVRKIVTETELPRTIIETLAVIAFKYPILQSDLIKIRTNKAYDHLLELEKSGYITRQKEGRTNLIKLTDKFFRYFDLTEDNMREKFKDFHSISQAIKEKEEDVKRIKEQQRKSAEDLKKQDEKIREEIESLDKDDEEFEIPLETYEAKKLPDEEKKEMIGNLEIVNPKDEKIPEVIEEMKQEAAQFQSEKKKRRGRSKPSKEKTEIAQDKEISREEIQVPAEKPKENPVEKSPEENPEEAGEKEETPKDPEEDDEEHYSLNKMSPEMQKKVDERVDEILKPKEEEKK